MTADLEIAAEGERQYDFCLWEYPAAAPAAGKLRSVNLLARSLREQGLGERGLQIVRALRQGLGDARTVWGIKQAGGQISWELYFYDYERVQRQRSIPRVLQLLRPWVACGLDPGEQHPYFMFSLDLDADRISGRRPLEDIQVYIGNIGSQVSSGICYEATAGGLRLKNLYYFFDAKSEMESIIGKATASVHLDPARVPLEAVFWPELLDCQTIVVANKQDRDGLYFCRIRVDQLLWFLKRMRFPAEEVLFVERNRSSLDHMLYDVGIDYRTEDGRLRIVKAAWYGVF